MNIQDALSQLFENKSLSSEDMSSVMRQVMTGESTPAQIGALLAALRMKGESVDEVVGAAQVMRDLASRVELHNKDAVDIVGTGGDASSTFNISTCCALLTAAAGVTIAKHGNRSLSSKSGAADYLEAAGVNIELTPEQVAQCIEQVGLGFMFAQRHHNAMKHAIGPRREIGSRTIFNLLGPLTNPAGVKNQLLGVYGIEWVRPVAEVLQKLGSRHVIVVHGDGNMDEISLSGPTHYAELKDGVITEGTIDPRDYGFQLQPLSAIQVGSPEESLSVINDVFNDVDGPARDIVLLNAGTAIYIGQQAESIAAGIEKAKAVLASGDPKRTLAKLVELTQSMKSA